MDLVESGLQKARVHLAQRRIRLDDFFSDFDHLRAGRITREQFRRALTVNGIELSLAELDAVCEAFDYTKVARVPGKGSSHRPAPAGLACKHEINYGAFLQALAESKPPRELLTSTTRRPLSLSPEEESRLLPTVQMLRHAVQAKGISIIPPFKDMDPLNTGKVTASQFERCIPFQTLDPSILKLFVRKYGDGQGNVYYNMWCREVDPTLQEKDELQAAVTAINTAPSSLFFSGSYKNPKLSSDELIRILREQFALYKLRCEDYFTDFDRFKTGTVTPPQFESALGRLNFVKFSLTEENVEALVQAYTVNPADPKDPTVGAFARVNYRSFLYDTNPKNFPVISADGHESTNYFISTHAADTFMRHTDELEAANRVLEKVRRLVKSNRIFLSPVLRDFDRVRKMIYEHRTCTSSRFGRGLATQNLILPPEELNVLIRKYTIPHPDGSASQDVNYYEFVQDVDPSQASVPGAVTTGAVVRGVLAQLQKEADHTRLRPATDLDELLQKIAQRAELRELRVGEFFLDFDPLRGGTLQQDKFITALGIAGLQLQDPEIELLKATYPSDKVRGHIDTARFLRDVGAYAPQSVPPTMLGGTMVASSTVANVAPAPAAEEAVAAASEDGVKKVSVAPFSLCSEAVQRLRLTEDERTRLSRLLFRLRHEVKTHSALLTPFFSDFDRFHHGKIPRMNFEQALARHRFVLSETDTDLLCRYYAVPTDPEMEDYRRFINEVGFEEGATWNTYTCAAAAAAAAAAVEAATTAGSAGQTSAANLTDCAEDAELQAVLAKVCCFLQERNPRVSEFFPDGDELRHQHVTLTRFRHCVSILGLHLTEPELHVLERAFASGRVEGEADYPAFVYTVRRMLDEGAGLRAVEQRRMGVPASGASTSVEEKVLAVAMDKIRRTLATRHTTALPAFREYDRTRKGQVKEGQFFVSLRALGVQLSPQEAGVVGKAFSLGNGEVGYIRFCKETDGAVSA